MKIICNPERISLRVLQIFLYIHPYQNSKMILLTFNIVDSDPALKNKEAYHAAERLEITIQNTNAILRSLENAEILATFFIEISLVSQLEKLVKKIVMKGHEIGLLSIGATLQEIEEAKTITEERIGKQIRGIRLPENGIVFSDLHQLRFTYASLNEDTAMIFPFRRFERKAPFTEQNGLTILHESISRYSQIPYSDYIFQIMPLSLYKNMVIDTIKMDEFVLIYLSSWQFTDFEKYDFNVSFHRKYYTGKKLHDKLEDFFAWMNQQEIAFSRIKDFTL